MSVTRVIAVSVILASLGVGVLHAQNLRNVQPPAEFPPASYTGTQYVDSRGCVYIRAGIDGNVTWVPRVNRQRNLLCGQTPTNVARGAPAAAPAARAPVQITVAPPVAAPAPSSASQAKPQPKPRVTTKPAPTPKPAPQVTVRRATAVAPVSPTPSAPKVVTVAPVKPAPQRTVARAVAPTPRQSACPGASPISQRYINSGRDLPVRCGPQPASPGTGQRITSGDPDTRVVPRHVYEQRMSDTVTTAPKGYRTVWEDDRLNPRRAEQSLAGIASTRLIWTQTVPRRLIERSSGRDVTSTVPLVYPYTDMATQQRELGSVTIVNRNGLVMKRVVRNTNVPVRQPIVSTRSAPTPVVKPEPSASKTASTSQYVQVGMFGDPANAQSAAQRLARTGLPARLGTLKRGGKSYRIVLAGPFDTPAKTARALGQAKAAGFNDAFVRK